METVLQFVAPIIMFTASLMGYGVQSDFVSPEAHSVELGLTEVSPRGEAGGFAVPASGCGVIHGGLPERDCSTTAPDISTNFSIIRLGDPVLVIWNPKSNTGCVLSNTVTSLITAPNSPTAPNANAVGSRIDAPVGEITYSITCDGVGNRDTVTVKVLPRIQET